MSSGWNMRIIGRVFHLNGEPAPAPDGEGEALQEQPAQPSGQHTLTDLWLKASVWGHTFTVVDCLMGSFAASLAGAAAMYLAADEAWEPTEDELAELEELEEQDDLTEVLVQEREAAKAAAKRGSHCGSN